MQSVTIGEWTKVTKSQVASVAKKLKDGEVLDVAICSSKIRPFGMWNCQFEFQVDKDLIRADRTDHDGYSLDNTVRDYMVYNCNAETGRYVHYYIK